MSSLSDVDWIFIVLAALYLSEMLVWARPGTSAYASSWGLFRGHFRARRLIGNDHGDLLIGGPAPFDVTLLHETLLLSLSDEGVVAFVAEAPLLRERPPQSEKRFLWSQLVDAHAVDLEVRVSDGRVCLAGSKRGANRLAAKLRELSRTPDDSRSSQIEHWRKQRHSVEAATERWNAWTESTLALRIGATLLFIWMFPIGLVLNYGWAYVQPDRWIVMAYLVILFLLWWINALVAWFSHQYLYPERRSDRWKQLAYSLLSPAVPLRLADSLGRDLFGWTHPLAISAVIDTRERFTSIAGVVLRDASYPRLPEEPQVADDEARAIIRASRDADRRCLVEILKSQQVDEQVCLAEPDIEDEATVSYCPRCLQEFVVATAQCESCGQRQSVALGSESLPQ